MIFLSSLGRRGWKAFPDDGEVADANADAFQLCGEHQDLLRAYVYVNPNGNWRDELSRWREHPHLAGVKLWTSCRDRAGRSEICIPLLEEAAEHGRPVLIHGFFRTGGTREGELSPVDIARLAARVPAVKIIMAHLGGNWEKALKAVAGQQNLYLDVSGGPASRGAVEGAVRSCGAARVLFGSDVPCRTIQSQLFKVYGANIPEEDRELILRQNAYELFSHVLR